MRAEYGASEICTHQKNQKLLPGSSLESSTPRWAPTQTAVSVDFLIWEMDKITGRFTRLENIGELCLHLCSKQMKSLLSCCVSSILWLKTTNPVALQIANNNLQPTRKNLKENIS